MTYSHSSVPVVYTRLSVFHKNIVHSDLDKEVVIKKYRNKSVIV